MATPALLLTPLNTPGAAALATFAQSEAIMVHSYLTIQSVGLGMISIAMVLSMMCLVKNFAERRVALADEGELIARGLVKGRDGRRPPTIERDLIPPVWFGFFPFVVVTPGLFVLSDAQTALIAGASAVLLGVFTWWLIPRMPPSDRLFDASYRVTLVALPVLVVSVILGLMLHFNLGKLVWRDDFSMYVTLGGIAMYAIFLIMGRLPRFRGEPASYLSVAGFLLIFAGLMVNTLIK